MDEHVNVFRRAKKWFFAMIMILTLLYVTTAMSRPVPLIVTAFLVAAIVGFAICHVLERFVEQDAVDYGSADHGRKLNDDEQAAFVEILSNYKR